MPEKINDKKLIALKAQFKEAKTAHIFQRPIQTRSATGVGCLLPIKTSLGVM